MATSRYLDLPMMPHGSSAQRPSPSFVSISSSSSFFSAGFDQHSKSSQLTDLTPLMTPLDSVDSIFGDDPDLEELPYLSDSLGWDSTEKQRKLHSLISKAENAFASLDDLELGPPLHFSDPVGWESLTDEEWSLQSLISRAECAIKSEHRKARSQMLKAEYAISQVEMAILKTLTQACLLNDIDNLSHADHEDFDAVAAARTKLVKGEQTPVTRRALEIMDQRSGFALESTEMHDASAATVNDTGIVDEIEDYAEDFELDDNEVLEVPATPPSSEINYFIDGDSTLETIEEVDDDTEQDWIHDAPPLPLRSTGVLVVPPTPLIRPLYVRDSPSFSTSDMNVSVSRLTMSPLVLNDPAISQEYFANTGTALGSPMIPVSSFPFRGRPPPPSHTETLDAAEVLEFEAAASRPNSEVATESSIQSLQDPGLDGLVPFLQVHYGSPLMAESMMKAITSGIYGSSFEMNSIGIGVESAANSEPERNQRPSFEPEKSPPVRSLECSNGFMGPTIRTGTPEDIRTEDAIVHVGPASNFSLDMATTTAISTTLGSPVMDNQNELKGFSLRFAPGFKQLLSRHSEIQAPEVRQSVTISASPIKDKTRLRRLRRRKSIQSIVDPTAPPLSSLPLKTRPDSFQTKPRNFFKKALNFLF